MMGLRICFFRNLRKGLGGGNEDENLSVAVLPNDAIYGFLWVAKLMRLFVLN